MDAASLQGRTTGLQRSAARLERSGAASLQRGAGTTSLERRSATRLERSTTSLQRRLATRLKRRASATGLKDRVTSGDHARCVLDGCHRGGLVICFAQDLILLGAPGNKQSDELSIPE